MRACNCELVVVCLSYASYVAVMAFPVLSTGLANKDQAAGSLKAERQAWSPFRFVQQSSKFVSFPSIPFSRSKMERVILPGEVLWSPSQSPNEFQFGPLDDVVMGGVSSSSFDDSTGIWSGTVTDANNGGFIGIRSYPSFQWDMSKCRGLKLKMKCASSSDARIKIGLRDSAEFNGVVWNSSLNVSNKVQTVNTPFSSLIPNRFANRIKTDNSFNLENVVGVQLVFSKFEYDGALNPRFRVGDFSLQVLEIKSY